MKVRINLGESNTEPINGEEGQVVGYVLALDNSQLASVYGNVTVDVAQAEEVPE